MKPDGPVIYIAGKEFSDAGLPRTGVVWLTNTVESWNEFKSKPLAKPVIHGGKKYRFLLWRELHEKDAQGKETVKVEQRWYFENESALQKAVATVKRETAGADSRNLAKPARADAADKSLLSKRPPSRCQPITEGDLKKRFEAILESLKKRFPRTVAMMRRKESRADLLAEAYLLDVAQTCGVVLHQTGPTIAGRIGAALAAFDSKPPRKPADESADTELLFNWFTDGYCFKSRKEIACAVNLKLGTRFTPAAIHRRAIRLGLPYKKPPGPSFKFPG